MKQHNVIMTKEGLEELKKEHAELISKKRPAVVTRLSDARTLGDLAENSEYSAAKDELAFIDGRIAELEEIIHKAKVASSKKTSKVDVGCKVTVHVNGKKDIFTLVGEWEADPMNKKISHSSPLGKALMGKKIGDEVQVQAPAGKISYQVLHIE